jgi:hypothetical protein
MRRSGASPVGLTLFIRCNARLRGRWTPTLILKRDWEQSCEMPTRRHPMASPDAGQRMLQFQPSNIATQNATSVSGMVGEIESNMRARPPKVFSLLLGPTCNCTIDMEMVEEYSKCSMILVMGVTGAGKSFFVNKVASGSVREGGTLRSGLKSSCTVPFP